MKRNAIVLLLIAASASAWAAAIAKPTAEITRFQVSAITLRDVTFLFELSVKNPYPVKLPFDGMTLDFNVEGSKVFSAASQGGFTVPANGEKSNSFTVTLAYDAIIKLVKDYTSKDWLATVINGTLTIPLPKIPGLPKNVTFSYTLKKKIPAVKPEVAIVDFTVTPPTDAQVAAAVAKAGKKVNPGKALGVFKDVLAGKKPAEPVIDVTELDVPLSVSFTLEIRNQAKGPLTFGTLGYALFVNKEQLVTGETSRVTNDAGTSRVTVTNVFSSARLSKSVQELFTRRSGSFTVTGSASVKLPDEVSKEPIPLSFNESGSFALK
jgi:LEA14-like dessication related protein